MKTVIPNIWTLLFRIALLFLFIYMYQWPLEKIKSGQYNDNIIGLGFGLIIFSIPPFYLLSTLLGVLWVQYSNYNSSISFHYIYKTVKADSQNVTAYCRTYQKTKLKDYHVLLIKLSSGKVIKISELNIKSINPILTFLNANRVPFVGDKF